MIDTVYYNDEIRCHRNGVVERFWRNKYWKIVENIDNTSNGYNRIYINKPIKRHRIIAYCFLGLDDIVGRLDKTNIIDHIDGNKLNNCVANLRITNNSENSQNRPNTKGYYFKKSNQKYGAKIAINYKQIHLGYYDTAEEAHQAYLEGKRIHHIF